ARLADARPADERQDVGVAREADATGPAVAGGPQWPAVETQLVGGVGSIERRGEATRQWLGDQGRRLALEGTDADRRIDRGRHAATAVSARTSRAAPRSS